MLFFAGVPEVLNLAAISVIRTQQDNYRVGLGSFDGVRYDVYSFLEEEAPPASLEVGAVPPVIRARYLQLPPLDPVS